MLPWETRKKGYEKNNVNTKETPHPNQMKPNIAEGCRKSEETSSRSIKK